MDVFDSFSIRSSEKGGQVCPFLLARAAAGLCASPFSPPPQLECSPLPSHRCRRRRIMIKISNVVTEFGEANTAQFILGGAKGAFYLVV